MGVAYGWCGPLALVNDGKADLQQALRNHEQAGRTGAITIFVPSGELDAEARARVAVGAPVALRFFHKLER